MAVAHQSGNVPPTPWSLTEGQRARYLAAIAAMAVGTVFLFLEPYLLKRALDDLAVDGRPRMGAIFLAAIGIVFCQVLHGLFTWLRARLAAQASEGVIRRLRHRLYAHLERLPCAYHDRADTGDLVQRCSSDVETVRVFLAAHIVEIARVVLLLGLAIPFMLWQEPRVTVLSLALFPLIILFAVLFFRRVRDLFRKVDEAEGRLTTVLQENLTGVRVVQAFARQDYEIAKFDRVNGEFKDLEYRLARLLSNYWFLSDTLVLAQLGLTLIGGAYFVVQGQISLGTWVLFSWLLRIIIWPVRQIGRVLTDSGKAVVSIERIQEVLRVPVEFDEGAVETRPRLTAGMPTTLVPAPQAAVVHETLAGPIEIQNLSFAYQDGQPVLRGLSLTIGAGETVALLGAPGAGKSTLVSLLLRLYDYQEGSIRVGGRELHTIPRDVVRRAFGVVLQDPFLYSRTVRENVLIGRSQAADHEVEESARAADIHENITEFDQGYETLVGERGVTLSGGQRQRLAIARALLKKPSFLVLDDSLSAVDTRTEAHILRSLAERRGRQTTILIAHRLSSTRLADRIFVLEQGRLIQSGTHDELLAVEGPYRRLWRIQVAVEDEIERDLSGAAPP